MLPTGRVLHGMRNDVTASLMAQRQADHWYTPPREHYQHTRWSIEMASIIFRPETIGCLSRQRASQHRQSAPHFVSNTPVCRGHSFGSIALLHRPMSRQSRACGSGGRTKGILPNPTFDSSLQRQVSTSMQFSIFPFSRLIFARHNVPSLQVPHTWDCYVGRSYTCGKWQFPTTWFRQLKTAAFSTRAHRRSTAKPKTLSTEPSILSTSGRKSGSSSAKPPAWLLREPPASLTATH